MDDDRRVIALRLSGNALSGAIPPEFGELLSIEALFLSGNRLTGCVPPALKEVANNDLIYWLTTC